MSRIFWNLRCDAVMLGYHIRPFDMLADRRRWFWQSRTPCQFSRRTTNLGR